MIKGIIIKEQGRSVSAISTQETKLFKLKSELINLICKQFPEIYKSMEKAAMKRFEFQQTLIAYNLRIYLARAANEQNEIDVENLSSISEFEIKHDHLDDFPNLNEVFIHNVSKLPNGVYIAGYGLILDQIIKEMIKKGYQLTKS